MGLGKVYGDDIKEKAFAMMACNRCVADIARELEIPYSTVRTWEKRALAKSEARAKKRREENNEPDEVDDEHDLALLRKRKKEEFVNDAWRVIGKAQSLLERRLSRALDSEDEIDGLLREVCEINRGGLTEANRKAIASKIAAIKVENVRDLSTVLGTLFDKQALASREPTEVVTGEVAVVKFEDL